MMKKQLFTARRGKFFPPWYRKRHQFLCWAAPTITSAIDVTIIGLVFVLYRDKVQYHICIPQIAATYSSKKILISPLDKREISC